MALSPGDLVTVINPIGNHEKGIFEVYKLQKSIGAVLVVDPDDPQKSFLVSIDRVATVFTI